MEEDSRFTQNLSKDSDTNGFDLQAGETWIYPTNYPTRDYQFNIIQNALFKNTLVSLPTGLGKTFIAAVVMYNFYRWYPQGKIIFMAPTKPLVKQQIDACYNIMAIPPEATAELTGSKSSTGRTNIWSEKRVFYITPQVLQNDLKKLVELGSKIKCLIFDEAHKARGNYAYCEVIRTLLAQGHKHFRVLALSATPGGNVNDVMEVIQNLLISHIEFRTEESLDVQPYVYKRSLETIVIPLSDKIQEIKDGFCIILEQYAKTLRRLNVVQGNCGTLTKGKIFMVMKEFKNKNMATSSANYAEAMKCLNICVTLYHAFELLIRHGLRNFLSFFDAHMEKPLLKRNNQLKILLDDVREYLGPVPNIEILPDGTYPEIPKDVKFGHPKYYKLRDILVSYFTENKSPTKVIVFFEYRESVMEAHTLLLQSRPLIQSRVFLGQGSGVTQKVQIGVVKAFREGRCNTLLSTCIGEEGLDVGEVDLIICFDISNKSPIRMVQRMGRTGRKREGRVLVLVTEGKEQQTLKDCLIHKNNISTFVLGSKTLNTAMYPDSPRLVPSNFSPRCEKIFITVKKNSKENPLKNMWNSRSSSSSKVSSIEDIQISDITERIPSTIMFFNKCFSHLEDTKAISLFNKHIEKQRSIVQTHKVSSSDNTKVFTDLLKFSDSKRYNISTQIQSGTQCSSTKYLKQGDIRTMFMKCSSSQQNFQPTQITQTFNDIATQEIKKNLESKDSGISSSVSKEVFNLISNHLFSQITKEESRCRHCPKDFICDNFIIPSDLFPQINNNNYVVPSDDILLNIGACDLENYAMTLDPNYVGCEFLESDIFNKLDFTQLENQFIKEDSIQKDTDQSFKYEVPKTYDNLLNKFGKSIFLTQEPTQGKKDPRRDTNSFVQKVEKSSDDFLNFFNLNALTDIFDTQPWSDETHSSEENFSKTADTILNRLSPDLLEDRITYKRIVHKPANTKQLLRSSVSQNVSGKYSSTPMKSSMSNSDHADSKSILDSSMNSSLNLAAEQTNFKPNIKEISDTNIDINKLCDLSYFGISGESDNNCSKPSTNIPNVNILSQICNLTEFGLTDPVDTELNNCHERNLSVSICEDEEAVENHLISECPKKTIKYSLNTLNISNNKSLISLESPVHTKKVESIEIDEDDASDLTQVYNFDIESPEIVSSKAKNEDVINSVNSLNEIHNPRPGTSKEMNSPDFLSSHSKIHPDKGHLTSISTQLSITQMLSLINKSQKRNVTNLPISPESKIHHDEFETLNSKNKKQTDKSANSLNLGSEKLQFVQNVKNALPLPSQCVQKEKGNSSQTKTHKSNKKTKSHTLKSTSSDEFEDSVIIKPPTRLPSKLKKNLKKKKSEPVSNAGNLKKSNKENVNMFLDLEAELDEDDSVIISEDEDVNEDLDCFEKSFVNDESHYVDTQMHAKYLQSIKSPAQIKVFRRPPKNYNINVYSQQVPDEPDTYLEDSFCVDVDDNEVTQQHELSELEILEKKLKQSKKRKKSENLEKKLQSKRRRIMSFSSDESS